MADYDGAAKALVLRAGEALWRRLAGTGRRGRPYDKELDPGRARLADNLFELDDGRFLHLEIQTKADPDMGWRMLRYHVLARDAIARALPVPRRPELLHWVIHLGADGRAMPTIYDENGATFRFEVLDLRREDPRPFLASGNAWDSILAVLCRGGGAPHILNEVRRRLESLGWIDRAEAVEAATALLILGELRGLEAVLEEMMESLDIGIDMPRSRLLRQPIEKAREQGRAEGITEGMARSVVKVLENRFGKLPETLADALHRADEQTLSAVLETGMSAGSLAEAVGPELAKLLPQGAEEG